MSAIKIAARRTRASGHVFGNHSMNHTIGSDYQDVLDAVMESEELYLSLGLGSLKPWFRSPNGEMATGMTRALPEIIRVLREQGYHFVTIEQLVAFGPRRTSPILYCDDFYGNGG